MHLGVNEKKFKGDVRTQARLTKQQVQDIYEIVDY